MGNRSSNSTVTNTYDYSQNRSLELHPEFEGEIGNIVTGDKNKITQTDHNSISKAFDFAEDIADGNLEQFKATLATINATNDDAMSFVSQALDRVTSNQTVQQEATKNQRYLMAIAGLVIVAVFYLRK